MSEKVKCLSLFAGIGGFEVGMSPCGFTFTNTLEWDENCCTTLNANRRFTGAEEETILPIDIMKMDAADFSSEKVDYIVGGPPCQSFSAAGRRAGGVAGTSDTRGTLFWYYCQYVKHFKPKAFVFENVRGILSSKKGEDFKIICASFEEVGYNLYWRILNAADFGVPQQRERVFLVDDLVKGDIEMTQCHAEAKEKDFEALRKFALILMNDYAAGEDSPVTHIFDDYVEPEKKRKIIEDFPLEKTNDDITLSYDQAVTLKYIIEQGAKYPELKGENDDVDFNEVVRFLALLSKAFKWGKYESETIGKSSNVLKWYAVILLQWIRGNGLRTIINSAINYKEKFPDTGVWVGNNLMAPRYDKNSKVHKNYIIAETLGVIENVLLFSISNYFRIFSIEYKEYHGIDHFDNDWYEFVEYGTTNDLTIFLQRVGFTRDSATYIESPKHRTEFIDNSTGEIKVKKAVLSCGNASVEMDAREIQFNMPELFID